MYSKSHLHARLSFRGSAEPASSKDGTTCARKPTDDQEELKRLQQQQQDFQQQQEQHLEQLEQLWQQQQQQQQVEGSSDYDSRIMGAVSGSGDSEMSKARAAYEDFSTSANGSGGDTYNAYCDYKSAADAVESSMHDARSYQSKSSSTDLKSAADAVESSMHDARSYRSASSSTDLKSAADAVESSMHDARSYRSASSSTDLKNAVDSPGTSMHAARSSYKSLRQNFSDTLSAAELVPAVTGDAADAAAISSAAPLTGDHLGHMAQQQQQQQQQQQTTQPDLVWMQRQQQEQQDLQREQQGEQQALQGQQQREQQKLQGQQQEQQPLARQQQGELQLDKSVKRALPDPAWLWEAKKKHEFERQQQLKRPELQLGSPRQQQQQQVPHQPLFFSPSSSKVEQASLPTR